MSEVLNPVEIEQQISAVANDIARGVPVVSNAETRAREARRVYDVAFAHAYINSDGPAHAKKYAAILATEKELEAADVAEVAFRHAERTARALTEKLRAYQSIGASVRAMYQTPGGAV